MQPAAKATKLQQYYCPKETCVYWDEDEINAGQARRPAINCKNANVTEFHPDKPCQFFRVDWKKQR